MNKSNILKNKNNNCKKEKENLNEPKNKKIWIKIFKIKLNQQKIYIKKIQ